MGSLLKGGSRGLNLINFDGIKNKLLYEAIVQYKPKLYGTAGRSRTDMKLPSLDFESSVSTIPPQRHIVKNTSLCYNKTL